MNDADHKPGRHNEDAPSDIDTATAGQPGGTENPPEEFGGPKGPEPTRYGDWERKGRCIDF